MNVFYAKCYLPDGTLIWCSPPCSCFNQATEEMKGATEVFDWDCFDWVITERAYEFEKEGGALGGAGRLPQI